MRRSLEILSVLWLLLALARFAFFFEIRQTLGVFLDWVPGLALLVGGLALAVAWVARAVRSRPRRPLYALPAVGLVAAGVLLWGTHLGPWLGIAAKLWRSETGYLEVVERVRADPTANLPDSREPIYVERGPPLRIAFSWGGVVDNWSGVVYDPRGGVLLVNDPDRAGEARNLFGGRMLRARHLWGPWYYCVFT